MELYELVTNLGSHPLRLQPPKFIILSQLCTNNSYWKKTNFIPFLKVNLHGLIKCPYNYKNQTNIMLFFFLIYRNNITIAMKGTD